MDYLSRRIEYQNLLHEIEIGGEEHLKVILENPDAYMKKANDLKYRVSSDSFLSGEDKEYFLEKVNGYVERIKNNKKDDFWNYALVFIAGAGLGHILPHNTLSNQNEFAEDVLRGFRSEIEKIRKDEKLF